MKLTPSSIARRRTAIAAAGSFGGPQIPSPVIRIAPKPRRLTVSSPPSEIVPPLAADRLVAFLVFLFIFHSPKHFVPSMLTQCDRHHSFHQAWAGPPLIQPPAPTLNRACSDNPTSVAIRTAGKSCPIRASAVACERAMRSSVCAPVGNLAGEFVGLNRRI